MASGTSRRALGRGLTNLIPQNTEEKGSENEVVLVDSNTIRPNPFQPRREFDQKEIEGLADSIQNQGLLHAIILRKKVDGYEIISGERRFRALRHLGRDQIPCIIKPKITDREMIEMALVENIQRENLNEIEQALAYQRLLLECGLSHEDLSKRVGKSRSAITNSLRLLKLPQDLQTMLMRGQITMGHARALLSVEDPQRPRVMAEKIVDGQTTVRDTEAAAQQTREKRPLSGETIPQKRPMAREDPNLWAVIEKMQHKFGTMVSIVRLSKDKGKIEIQYHNEADFNRIADILVKG